MNLERFRSHKQITNEETLKARKREYNRGFSRWPVFESSAVGYFSDEDDQSHISFYGLETITNLKDRLKRIKGSGKMIGVDVLGQGQACKDVGCDVVFANTLDNAADDKGLETVVHDAADRGVVLETFDLFDREKLHSFISMIEDQADKPLGLVFFRPYGGLEQYFYRRGEQIAFDNDYAVAYLYKEVLTPLYRLLEPRGVMFLELHGLPPKYFKYFVELLEQNQIWITCKPDTNVIKIEKPSLEINDLPELGKTDMQSFSASMN